eukprot:8267160-Pyramimonas_sp.AAC.2
MKQWPVSDCNNCCNKCRCESRKQEETTDRTFRTCLQSLATRARTIDEGGWLSSQLHLVEPGPRRNLARFKHSSWRWILAKRSAGPIRCAAADDDEARLPPAAGAPAALAAGPRAARRAARCAATAAATLTAAGGGGGSGGGRAPATAREEPAPSPSPG